MRLIDADKLKAHYSWWKGGGREMTMDEAKRDFDTIVDLQPTVEPKHGRWIYFEEIRAYSCSECHRYQYGNTLEVTVDDYKFCPNCGAIMDGEKE